VDPGRFIHMCWCANTGTCLKARSEPFCATVIVLSGEKQLLAPNAMPTVWVGRTEHPW
jgi:hypothetical protein